MLHLQIRVSVVAVYLCFLLLLEALLLLFNNRLIRFKVFSDPLIYSLLPNLVIICRLYFDHIF